MPKPECEHKCVEVKTVSSTRCPFNSPNSNYRVRVRVRVRDRVSVRVRVRDSVWRIEIRRIEKEPIYSPLTDG